MQSFDRTMLIRVAAQIFQCSWKSRSVPALDDSSEYFVLDLDVEGGNKNVHVAHDLPAGNVHENSKLGILFEEVLRNASNKSRFAVPVKVLLPAFDGCFAQDNIIQDRFVDSPTISAICRLAPMNKEMSAPSHEAISTEGLASLVESGVVALIGKDTASSGAALAESHCQIDGDIQSRLQLAWWQRELPAPKTLACVFAGPNWKYYKPIWETAEANRIGLVIIAQPGHWLGGEKYRKLYERFIPLALTNQDGSLGERIAEALKQSGTVVKGIIASSDDHLLPSAQAATILGIPTQPPSAYAVCRDKHAARQLRTSAIQSYSVATEDEALALVNDDKVQYPLIVKPQHGKSSFGVAKITAPSQMMPAVSSILSEFHDTVVIETYITGPELDVNLVLCGGKVLFCEILDDFPSEGDDDTAGPSASFLESAMSSPSGLPADELEMVKASALGSVLAAGFDTGMFHVEGKVVNSQMEYVQEAGKGIQLRSSVKGGGKAGEAQFVLIEINARPPAFCCVQASKLTYGVDFYEQWMFAALHDTRRMAVLARPFSFAHHPTGAQYWSHNLIFPNTRGGIFDAGVWESMLASHQDMLPNFSAVDSPWEDGEAVPDPATGRKRFLAYFIICSREGRDRVGTMASEVERRMGGVLADGLVRQ